MVRNFFLNKVKQSLQSHLMNTLIETETMGLFFIAVDLLSFFFAHDAECVFDVFSQVL